MRRLIFSVECDHCVETYDVEEMVTTTSTVAATATSTQAATTTASATRIKQ